MKAEWKDKKSLDLVRYKNRDIRTVQQQWNASSSEPLKGYAVFWATMRRGNCYFYTMKPPGLHNSQQNQKAQSLVNQYFHRIDHRLSSHVFSSIWIQLEFNCLKTTAIGRSKLGEATLKISKSAHAGTHRKLCVCGRRVPFHQWTVLPTEHASGEVFIKNKNVFNSEALGWNIHDELLAKNTSLIARSLQKCTSDQLSSAKGFLTVEEPPTVRSFQQNSQQSPMKCPITTQAGNKNHLGTKSKSRFCRNSVFTYTTTQRTRTGSNARKEVRKTSRSECSLLSRKESRP